MRLNDKLIRKNCPSCGGEITLSASALDKKINCPKCWQTVVIPSGGGGAPPKPSSKKTKPREKRNGHGHHAPVEPPEPPPPVEQEEIRISIRRRNDDEDTQPLGSEGFDDPLPEQQAVVYCICNGVLKKCKNTEACCVKPAFCVFADEMGL